jgi:hypothetical protein
VQQNVRKTEEHMNLRLPICRKSKRKIRGKVIFTGESRDALFSLASALKNTNEILGIEAKELPATRLVRYSITLSLQGQEVGCPGLP